MGTLFALSSTFLDSWDKQTIGMFSSEAKPLKVLDISAISF
nr:hypothetical protein N-3 - Chlamydia trachomatis plasmid pLGV440 [Chlamydia trachomatis]